MGEPKTMAEAQLLISRLKTLSKAQTTLLKAHLHKKLTAASDLVAKAVDAMGGNSPKLMEIQKSFQELNLDEIQVDVTSPQLLFGEDLAVLRKAVGGVVMSTTSSGNSGGDSIRVQTLESENANLRELLQQAKTELLTSSANNSGDVKAALQQMKEEGDKKLSDLMNQMKDMETKFEAEKEEMMEAMAQEVDDIEKAKETQRTTMEAEKEALQKSLAASSNSSKAVQSNLVVLRKKMSSTKDGYRNFATAAKKDLQDMKQELMASLQGSLLGRCRKLEEMLKDIQEKYRKEALERKKLHNEIQELKGNIRVYLRCRPPTTKEKEQFGNDALCVSFPTEGAITVFNSEKNREKTWDFDEVFGLSSTQEKVYKDVSGLVVSVLDGYNVCIFAYGQTGSGKTYTMSGPPEDRGVNTRALDELFARTKARDAMFKDQIAVSVLEVYNEEIRDLLVAGGGDEKLEVRQGPEGMYVPGLTAMPVNKLEDVIELLGIADVNRSSRGTDMNEHSSRSHMMLTVTVTTESRANGAVTRGKLNLVDLAGSERVGKSGAVGQAMKEAQNINKSLSALGDVIAARANKQGHVPFRNSTLTYLLQDSLSQDSKTLMIVCISPVQYNAQESYCSLDFASRVNSVELGKASKNVVGGAKKTSIMSNGNTTLRFKPFDA